ncbi:NosY protein [Hydrogenobacter hydrogenophilus]|uniref:Cu-processing system permease protein n=1 Tax=Hydrogenobacter hydrogenophilus TaxID=35835 RepID=A0A285P4M5_9AQUI|nr:NosY protein [Hydrogenobacter hydrogenophilus]SNZ16670.1 Cu-processing system permease protein [Hydrogenobacter hydrogenophilus]
MFAKLIKYVSYDLLKSRWVFATFLFYALTVYILLEFGRSAEKVVVSYGNISYLSLSLFSLLLSTAYLYNNRNFLEFLLSQPVRRSTLFMSISVSLSLSLGLSYLLGSIVPFYYLMGYNLSFFKCVLLNLSIVPLFVNLGLFSALFVEDRIRGLGFSIFLWLFLCLFYDALLLYMVVLLSDYPVYKLFIGLTIMNPLDLLRLTLLMDAGLYELMGFVGKWLARYLKDFYFLPILLSIFYTLLLFIVNLFIFKRRDF